MTMTNFFANLYMIGTGYATLITPEGTINLLNPQSAALQCISIDSNYRINFVDCQDSSVSTFETVQADETYFQIRMTNNEYSNENLCFELDNAQTIVMDSCNDRSEQLFSIDDSALKNQNSESLCVTPWYDKLRNMPCARLNERFQQKFYNFDDLDDALANQQSVKKALAPRPLVDASSADEIENLKLYRHGYLVLKKRVAAAFADDEVDYEGLYRWNHGAKRFEHFLDLRKSLYLSTETKQFEVSIPGLAPERMSESQVSEPTKLSKFYFERYELVELEFFDDEFCPAFEPCQNGAQCHSKRMGFTCSCNPDSLQFGPLCDQPTPCADQA